MGRTIELRLVPAVLGGAFALVLASTGGAMADKLITGDDVKDGSLTGRDIKTGSVRAIDLSGDVRDPLQRIGHFKTYEKTSEPVASGGDAYVQLGCPAATGTRALSAGAAWEDSTNGTSSTVQVSRQEGSSDSGWFALGHNASDDTDRLVLTVTCGRVAYFSGD